MNAFLFDDFDFTVTPASNPEGVGSRRYQSRDYIRRDTSTFSEDAKQMLFSFAAGSEAIRQCEAIERKSNE